MTFTETEIRDLIVIEPRVFEDSRGYFFESFNEKELHKRGINLRYVQDNQSKSEYGVIRGLHYQKKPHAQSKLVRVLEGEIMDVALDLRKGSRTFGKWHGVILSSENKKQLLIPEGFAHGFSVLSPTAIVLYKCNDFYHPETEDGIIYNDPFLKIDWKISSDEALISEKDKKLSRFDPSVHIFE